jgi:hypothetical protein
MYHCIVSFTVLPDTCELSREIIHEEIIPLLRQQSGLVDIKVLQSSDEPSQFLVISSSSRRRPPATAVVGLRTLTSVRKEIPAASSALLSNILQFS